MKTLNPFSTAPVPGRQRGWQSASRSAFTLVELLVVIAVIGALAALTLSVTKGVNKKKVISTATAELSQIESALENYKAKYGVYPPSNGNPTGKYIGGQTNALYPQLYYELMGVTNNGSAYTLLDGTAPISISSSPTDVNKAFGVDGFLNSSKGNGEEVIPAQNFLLSWRQRQVGSVSDLGVNVSNLVTSVGGPDVNYMPLGVPGVNPFRYVYPGVNNPSSYDLYVQVEISGQTNLVCNWTKQVIVNSPLP